MGLELTTPRSRVTCSSDWASQAPHFCFILSHNANPDARKRWLDDTLNWNSKIEDVVIFTTQESEWIRRFQNFSVWVCVFGMDGHLSIHSTIQQALLNTSTESFKARPHSRGAPSHVGEAHTDTWMCIFIYPFNTRCLSTYWVPGPVLGHKVAKLDRPYPYEVHSLLEKTSKLWLQKVWWRLKAGLHGAGRVSGTQMWQSLPGKEVFKQEPVVRVYADEGEEASMLLDV